MSRVSRTIYNVSYGWYLVQYYLNLRYLNKNPYWTIPRSWKICRTLLIYNVYQINHTFITQCNWYLKPYKETQNGCAVMLFVMKHLLCFYAKAAEYLSEADRLQLICTVYKQASQPALTVPLFFFD